MPWIPRRITRCTTNYCRILSLRPAHCSPNYAGISQEKEDMAKPRHFVTANRLDDGSVVYLTDARHWAAAFTAACAFEDATAASSEVAWAKTQEHHVCGPYTFEAEVAEDGTANLSSRERLRRAGGESARARLGY